MPQYVSVLIHVQELRDSIGLAADERVLWHELEHAEGLLKFLGYIILKRSVGE